MRRDGAKKMRLIAEEAALNDANVQRAMEGKPVRKLIYVPNRIVNVVV